MTEEDEEKRTPKDEAKKRSKIPLICAFIAIVVILAGITALILWLVYRPRKPKFGVVAASVYELNATSPPFMSTAMQFTVVTRNPNKRLSISFDQFRAFVSYKDQLITPPVFLPPLFQEPKSTVVLSPVLGCAEVPVAAEVFNGLAMDEAYGAVGLSLILTGRLTYKAGSVIKSFGHYGVYVRCDLFVGLKKGLVGLMPLIGSDYIQGCRVDV